jgi:hypothetical protein
MTSYSGSGIQEYFIDEANEVILDQFLEQAHQTIYIS